MMTEWAADEDEDDADDEDDDEDKGEYAVGVLMVCVSRWCAAAAKSGDGVSMMAKDVADDEEEEDDKEDEEDDESAVGANRGSSSQAISKSSKRASSKRSARTSTAEAAAVPSPCPFRDAASSGFARAALPPATPLALSLPLPLPLPNSEPSFSTSEMAARLDGPTPLARSAAASGKGRGAEWSNA
jgi:hypothetical protein